MHPIRFSYSIQRVLYLTFGRIQMLLKWSKLTRENLQNNGDEGLARLEKKVLLEIRSIWPTCDVMIVNDGKQTEAINPCHCFKNNHV